MLKYTIENIFRLAINFRESEGEQDEINFLECKRAACLC